jgi:hypothetical protein
MTLASFHCGGLARDIKPIEAFCMTLYITLLKSTQGTPKTKAELREMLAEAVRNTQPKPKHQLTQKEIAAKPTS